MTALSSNSLEVYTVPPPSKSKDPLEAASTYTVELPGHRNDVRTLCLSSDDQLLASASNGKVKLVFCCTTSYAFLRLSQNMEYENNRLYPHNGLQSCNM